MTDISRLPPEVLVHIISFLPTSSLTSVWGTSTQWRDLSRRPLTASIQSYLADSSYNLSEVEMDIATDLVTSEHLAEETITNLSTRIKSSWSNGGYCPCAAEVRCAAMLVTSGRLEEDVMTTLSTRIQSSFNNEWTSVAEVRCAAALAATGHLNSVEYMLLGHLELPSIKDMPSLARVVTSKVWLRNVTGNIGPLLSSITCPELVLSNIELGQTATSSGVSGKVWLEKVTGDIGSLLSSLSCRELLISTMELDLAATCRGVSGKVWLRSVTGDLGPLLSSLSCTRLVINNTELDQAATSSLVRALQHGVERLWLGTRGLVRLHIQTLVEYDGRGLCGELTHANGRKTTINEQMQFWAARINWDVVQHSDCIVMSRI